MTCTIAILCDTCVVLLTTAENEHCASSSKETIFLIKISFSIVKVSCEVCAFHIFPVEAHKIR